MVTFIEVDEIFWSHGRIRRSFRNGRTLKKTLKDLCDENKSLKVTDFPRFEVVHKNWNSNGLKYYAVTGNSIFSAFFPVPTNVYANITVLFLLKFSQLLSSQGQQKKPSIPSFNFAVQPDNLFWFLFFFQLLFYLAPNLGQKGLGLELLVSLCLDGAFLEPFQKLSLFDAIKFDFLWKTERRVLAAQKTIQLHQGGKNRKPKNKERCSILYHTEFQLVFKCQLKKDKDSIDWEKTFVANGWQKNTKGANKKFVLKVKVKFGFEKRKSKKKKSETQTTNLKLLFLQNKKDVLFFVLVKK